MNQPTRRMSDLAPSRAPARPKSHPSPTTSRAAALRKQAEHQAKAYKGRATKVAPSKHSIELADPAFATQPLHPLGKSRAKSQTAAGAPGYAEPLLPAKAKRKLFGRKAKQPEPGLNDAFFEQDEPKPVMAKSAQAAVNETLAPVPLVPVVIEAPVAMPLATGRSAKGRGWLIVGQLLLSMGIILLVAGAVVYVYIRYYQ